jgi:hypothetical protein
MAKYSVHFFCNECGDVHPIGISVNLNDGPTQKASIGDTYAGKELNPNIANLINNKTKCPKTDKWTSQKDNNQVFLVPIGE